MKGSSLFSMIPIVEHLGVILSRLEIAKKILHASYFCPTMFKYCVEVLNFMNHRSTRQNESFLERSMQWNYQINVN